jgi:hypothetical protein
MQGQYDGGNQPPSYAELAAQTLSQSSLFVFRAFPHAVLFSPSSEIAALRPTCAMQLVAEFVNDPARPPQGICVANLPPPTFAGD